MQRAGSRSWRLDFDVPEPLHLALYVRDALDITDRVIGAEAPPQLLGAVPDHSSRLAAQDRDQAAAAWGSWWSTLIEEPAHTSPATPAKGAVKDAAEDLNAGAQRWFKEHSAAWIPPALAPPDAMRNWEIARDAAEAAARKLAVDPGELEVRAWLVLVEDPWSLSPSPGSVLYSTAVQQDETQLFEVLCDAFISSV